MMSAIRVWAAMAWADGVLADAEAEGLKRLIATAELAPEERTLAHGFLGGAQTLPTAFLATATPEARHGIYRAACRMAVVDQVVADAEKAMLAKLRTLLAIAPEAAQEIEADVPGLA